MGKLRGKVVVLEFWATWCGPCVAAMPHMNGLADRYKGKVQFIEITDEGRETVAPFLAKRPMSGWVGLDTDRSVFDAYCVKGIPMTVLVRPDSRGQQYNPPGFLTPVRARLGSSYEYDSFTEEAFHLSAPAKSFFSADELRWNGFDGYRRPDGRLVFLDPCLSASGPTTLLADREHLLAYLQQRKQVIIWTVLSEKLYFSDISSNALPRLLYDRVHMLEGTGKLTSSKPTILRH